MPSLIVLAAALIGAFGPGDEPATESPRALTSAIYPNPSSNRTTVTVFFSSGSGPFEIVLFDVIGRRVATAYRSELPFPAGTFNISIDGYDVDTGEVIPPGYYFLAIIGDGALVGSTKFVLG
ncbi:MAG TPA: T9SS type A sorting domain-containing protein [Candidatus Kapabacteria bacterium]|jgi:hypothetical protein|nr:T9SS type A sorting domain-containing protein [Candidatus Kapabacteria bacterium]